MNNNKSTLDYLRTLLIEELELDEERVNIYNQKYDIPTKDGLFIYLEYRGAPQIISSRNRTEMVNGEYVEVQDLNTLEDITIGLFSKTLEAVRLKEKVVMALYSVLAQQMQEVEGFKIFPNARIVPLSMLEGMAQLYRFDVEVRVSAWYNNTKTAEFFDAHRVQVIANEGNEDLESTFAIPDTDPTVYPKT